MIVILQGHHVTYCHKIAFHQMIKGVSCAVSLNQHTVTAIICGLLFNQCLDCLENQKHA
jgi:hypothetical protein